MLDPALLAADPAQGSVAEGSSPEGHVSMVCSAAYFGLLEPVVTTCRSASIAQPYGKSATDR